MRDGIDAGYADRRGAAAYLGVSVDTFLRWVADGVMPRPTLRQGQIIRWRRQDRGCRGGI